MNAVSTLMGGTENSYCTGYTSLMGENERLGKESSLLWSDHFGCYTEDGWQRMGEDGGEEPGPGERGWWPQFRR